MDMTRRAAAVLVLAAAALVIPAAPGMAAVPGLEIVSTATVGDSSSPKTIAVSCPAGKQVVGTGVYVDGQAGYYGEVIVDDLIPMATSVRATGYEDQDGTDVVWWIRAFAVCANPLAGIELITATSASTSSNKSVIATCSSGKRAIGTGAAITGGLGQVVLTTMLSSTTSTYAVATEDADGTTANWYVTSYAICAPAPAGLEAVSLKSVTDSQNKSLSPACTAGKRALSTGWEITEPGRVVPGVAMPNTGGALVFAAENGPSVSANWTLGARVMCAAA
jgi:hypothetical protein